MIQFASVARSTALSTLDESAGARLVVTGDIVTMSEHRDIILGGRLCLNGHTIVAVLRPEEELPIGFEHAPVVETGGTIYPGLIDLHNHLPYNMVPLWQVDRQFQHRLQWQGAKEYYPAVRAPFGLLNEHKTDAGYVPAIVRFVECKGLFGGVTTGHGMALTNKTAYEGLIRNIEWPLAPELQTVRSNTADFSAEKLAEMLEWTKQERPYIYHLSEGVGDYGEKVFRQLEQAPLGLNPHLACIHCVGIPADGWDAMKVVAGIVWSPTSNLLLYGQTCRVDEARKRNIPVAIGADWAPSGCKNLLGELKVARAASQHMGGVLSDADLVAGVTCVPARMIKWDRFLGSLEAGKWADLLVLEGTGGDHYGRLLEARETSIRAVVIGGRVRLGEAGGLVISDPLSSESVSIGGKSYVIDLAEPGTDGLGGVKLSDAVVKIRDGLARLPEFEKGQIELALMGVRVDDQVPRLEDEMNPESLSWSSQRVEKLPARAMRLEPMTAVDDPDFKSAMRASVNMPEYAKRAFDF